METQKAMSKEQLEALRETYMKELQKYDKESLTAKQRITFKNDTQVVDKETGEVISEESTTQTTSTSREPDFIKLYIHDIVLLQNLPKMSNGILYELLRLVNYDNQIVLNPAIKKNIVAKLGISKSTLDCTLTKLCKEDIIIRQDTGIYMCNPYLFARGRWEDIQQLRLTINYSSKGREILVSKIHELEEQNKEM